MIQHNNTPCTETASHTCCAEEPRPYFTPAQWIIFGVLVVLGLVLRWTLLDMRPYHHDESLHGMYGRYFYDWPNQNFYKYDPMLHGPMLYNCMRFIYAMFGDSLWAARTPVCIMGSLFILVPYLFRAYLRPTATLLLTGAVALSPTLIYWSRFLREDYWVVSGMLLVVYGCTRAPNGLRPFLILLGICVQWCTKENIFVSAALVAGYLYFEDCFRLIFERRVGWMIVVRFLPVATIMLLLFGLTQSSLSGTMLSIVLIWSLISFLLLEVGASYFIRHPAISGSNSTQGDSTLARMGLFCWNFPWHTAFAFMVAAGIYCWFYSAGFRFPEGIEWGLGRKGFEYWMKHHGMERIEGPFNFHIYVLGWYELPFFLAFLLHMFLFYRRASLGIQLSALAVTCGALVTASSTDITRLKEIEIFNFHIWKFFKAKDRLDLLGVFLLLFHAPLVTIQHMWRREYTLAATGYFFTATFFVYSYLGEKVPWLTLYPLIFGLPYLTLFFQDYAQRYGWKEFSQFRVRSALAWLGAGLITVGLLLWFEQKVWFAGDTWVSGIGGWFNAAPVLVAGLYLILFLRELTNRVGCAPLLDYRKDAWRYWIVGLVLLCGLTSCFRQELSSIPSLLFWFEDSTNIGMPIEAMLVGIGLLCALFATIDGVDPFLGTMNLGRWVFACAALFSLRAAVQTNYLYAGKETEYLSQVHTTYDVAEVAHRIENEVLSERNNYRPKVLAAGESTWPLTWYFRRIPGEYAFTAQPNELDKFTYIFQDWKETPEPGQIPEGYFVRRLNLRGWWVPDFKQMTLKRFLEVSINHYPWSPSGFQYVNLLVAKDTARFTK